MRYSPGQKQQTRARIVEAAGRVFRRRGYHAAGVDLVMEEAGLTAGGFYSHFGSKEALLSESLIGASRAAEAGQHKRLGGRTGVAWVSAFVESYLDPAHRENVEGGCPLAALVSEISRSGSPVKTSFETIVRGIADRLAAESGDRLTEDRALAIVAICVGGLGLARSVHDEALSQRILAACRELALEGLS